MCNSARENAKLFNELQATDTFACAVNEECDGVRCSAEYTGEMFYEEFLVFPCAQPPAVEYVIEDADLHPLAQVIFDRSGTYTLDETESVISFIERGPRSISIEVCEL